MGCAVAGAGSSQLATDFSEGSSHGFPFLRVLPQLEGGPRNFLRMGPVLDKLRDDLFADHHVHQSDHRNPDHEAREKISRPGGFVDDYHRPLQKSALQGCCAGGHQDQVARMDAVVIPALNHFGMKRRLLQVPPVQLPGQVRGLD